MTKRLMILKRIILLSVMLSIAVLVFYFYQSKYHKNENSEDNIKTTLIREPTYAGSFYPKEANDLTDTVQGFLNLANEIDLDRPKAIIVPHAGYVYSGQVAAHAYKLLTHSYKKIFIIASNHSAHAGPFTFSISNHDFYRTPLGLVKVSDIAKKLLKKGGFSFVPEAHNTHVIEVHLPFLQLILKNFEIIPIITGDATLKDIKALSRELLKYIDSETLLIISSDLSHYHPYKTAVAKDSQCINAIEKQNLDGTIRCEACGQKAILLLLLIAQEKGWISKTLDYKNSGDVSGSKDRVVGYSSIVFFEPILSRFDKQRLLTLSRRALVSVVKNKKNLNLEKLNKEHFSDAILKKQGCFVTLNKKNQLRGCIGHIIPRSSLLECVLQNTENAALKDQRFHPVTRKELNDITIEISVLSIPQIQRLNTPEDILHFLIPQKHGVILQNEGYSSTYLPQVWDSLPDKIQFLTQLCLKGGMMQDCWKDPRTEIFTYEAIHFSEVDDK